MYYKVKTERTSQKKEKLVLPHCPLNAERVWTSFTLAIRFSDFSRLWGKEGNNDTEVETQEQPKEGKFVIQKCCIKENQNSTYSQKMEESYLSRVSRVWEKKRERENSQLHMFINTPTVDLLRQKALQEIELVHKDKLWLSSGI